MKSRSFAAALLFCASPLIAGSPHFESEEAPTALVELFTSEGCSSCPPADAWMSGLKTSPDLWKRFVPVAFHVDYWNGLGWQDRFATAANTARQRRYAATWGTGSIYTPGLVLNGHEWRDWFRSAGVPQSATTKVGRLAVTVQDGQANIAYTRAGGVVPLSAEVVLLGSNLESNVTRGENSGHKLRHDFTALYFAAVPLHRDGDHFTANVPLPPKTREASGAIAAWIIAGEAQPPIQATGGWLSAH